MRRFGNTNWYPRDMHRLKLDTIHFLLVSSRRVMDNEDMLRSIWSRWYWSRAIWTYGRVEGSLLFCSLCGHVLDSIFSSLLYGHLIARLSERSCSTRKSPWLQKRYELLLSWWKHNNDPLRSDLLRSATSQPITPLCYTSQWGLTSLEFCLLESEESSESFGPGGTALAVASFCGQENAIKLLM